MADRYRVVIIDPSEFDWERYPVMKKDKSPYDLYGIWESGLDMPDGTWVEEWTVPNGADPKESKYADLHYLVKHETHVIDWDEIGEPHMIKTKEWWDERIALMKAMVEVFRPLYPLADKLMKEVQEITDPDGESIHEAIKKEVENPDVP